MHFRTTATILALLACSPAMAQDFSCMEIEVKDKMQMTAAHVEYDVIFRNNCPGAVYWTACVETMNPWSYEISTPLEPRGMIDKNKRAKVNLQMKEIVDRTGSRGAYQWFYVTPAYSLESDVKAQCMARPCEALKADLRREWNRNDAAWQKTLLAVSKAALDRCPKTAWDDTERETCMSNVKAEYATEMQTFESRQSEIERQLEDVEPVNCVTHGGH